MLALMPQNPQTIPYDFSYFFGWSFLVKSVSHPTEPANYTGCYTTDIKLVFSPNNTQRRVLQLLLVPAASVLPCTQP